MPQLIVLQASFLQQKVALTLKNRGATAKNLWFYTDRPVYCQP